MKQFELCYEDSVFCMEYTGIYNMPLLNFLRGENAKIWMESGAQISKSSGLIRGKSDKIDSGKIAIYAFANRYKMKQWVAPRESVQRVMFLLAQRARLIKAKKMLKVAAEEQRAYLDKETAKSIDKINAKPVEALLKSIELTDKEILNTIKADERLSRLYKIITSVDGVGMVTAAYMITTTNEFLSINESKKYACYSGVVPFEHSSGVSIRGKNRVSHMANKKIKTLLHMAALSAIQVQGDMQTYYNRMVEQGKNKMSVLNAVRNKIIQRVFACVKNDRMYEKNYQYSLV
jgi:transposase